MCVRRTLTEQGQIELLLRLVQHRFGHVPDAVTQRIQAAQASQLKSWALNILDAATLDDVFHD